VLVKLFPIDLGGVAVLAFSFRFRGLKIIFQGGDMQKTCVIAGLETGILKKVTPLKPLEPGTIVNCFSRVKTKSDVIKNFLNFSKHYFENTAVFAVYPDYRMQLVGSCGPKMRQVGERFGSVTIERTTIFRRVVANNYSFHGRFPVGDEERKIFSSFAVGFPDEIWVWPAQVGDSVDFLFYAEQPKAQRQWVSEKFEYLIEKAALSLRLLLVKKQLTTI
jgi:hypothetical protein